MRLPSLGCLTTRHTTLVPDIKDVVADDDNRSAEALLDEEGASCRGDRSKGRFSESLIAL
jgi:hypothetical protein